MRGLRNRLGLWWQAAIEWLHRIGEVEDMGEDDVDVVTNECLRWIAQYDTLADTPGHPLRDQYRARASEWRDLLLEHLAVQEGRAEDE